MLKIEKLDRREVRWHTIGWCIYLMVTYVFFFTKGTLAEFLVRPFAYLCIITSFYIVSLIVYPSFWLKGRYILFIIIIICLYAINTIYYYSMYYRIVPLFDRDLFDTNFPTGLFIRQSAFWTSYNLFAAIVFSYYRKNITDLKRRNKIEKELAETQLLFLQSQFSPHFLFNVLNYIYDKSIPISDDLSRAVLLLSDMMRYSLEGVSSNVKVPLNSEVKHIKNLIDLHKLRFGQDIFVNLDINEGCFEQKIVPLLLIPFVENAFKYGEYSDPSFPIAIIIDSKKGVIRFSVENKKKRKIGISSHQIGHKNVSQRLELAYADRHKLIIDDRKDTYYCSLSIFLN